MKGEWNYFVMDSRIFPGYVAVGCLLVYFSGVAMRRLLSIIIIITTERKITAIMERFHNKWNRCHDMARDTNTQTTACWTNIYTMQWPHSKPNTHTHTKYCVLENRMHHLEYEFLLLLFDVWQGHATIWSRTKPYRLLLLDGFERRLSPAPWILDANRLFINL